MNRRKGFCNLVEGYKKINEQDEFVSESRGVECTPSKLYENKKRAIKNYQGNYYQV